VYGRTIRDFALRLLDRGLVHVVASDAHGGRRPARIAGELRDTQIGPELSSWLTDEAPAALLAGESLPPRPEGTLRMPRRRLLRHLRH
jgi:tyrosine-protein phosphatase YwqE